MEHNTIYIKMIRNGTFSQHLSIIQLGRLGRRVILGNLLFSLCIVFSLKQVMVINFKLQT